MGTINSFPLSAGTQIGSNYIYSPSSGDVTLEPSGLVVLNNTLYMASDNGYLMKMDVSAGANVNTSWTMSHNFTNDDGYSGNKDSYDLESITVVSGDLMIGVEGSSSYSPRIIRYDVGTNDPTGSTWTITDVTLTGGGMEAMTFVPSSACSNFGGNAAYGGYFFAAYQSKTGYVYVYDLPQGNKSSHTVSDHLKKFALKDGNNNPISLEASDMCFADNYLFVLFDGGGSSGQKDEIHIFSIDADGNGLTHAGACALPVIEGVWTAQTDFEGITIDGTNLYLSVDARDSTKLVYRYSDFSISKFV